ncbi:MAG: POTRA domain-containing protein [Ignavibacteria bacterium]
MFEGNKNISSSDLKSAMDETSETVWWNIFDGATFDKKKYEEDKVLIENYYKENGFKDAFIQDDELIILPSKEDVNIKIKINEGKKYYVNNVTFEGNTIFEPDLLYARLGFRNGEVYNSKKLNENLYGNESESDISSLYLDKGYLD